MTKPATTPQTTPATTSRGRRLLRVVDPGPLALVEDLGRPGRASYGVGRSGAADRGALRSGNRVLGNPEDAAGVEATLGGLVVEVGEEPLWACVTGAPVDVVVDGRPVGSHAPLALRPGARLSLGVPRVGLRCYLTVRGGVAVEPVLGSRSHDVMAGLGPAPLRAGDELPVGPAADRWPGVDLLPAARPGGPVVLRAVRGPRAHHVVDADVLVRTTWRATEHSNRVGTRLTGARLERAGGSEKAGELPSEAAWRGAVQVPPSGEPVVFLADHPVTGGYPVVAVVVDADVDRAAQVAPGQQLRFRWVGAP